VVEDQGNEPRRYSAHFDRPGSKSAAPPTKAGGGTPISQPSLVHPRPHSSLRQQAVEVMLHPPYPATPKWDGSPNVTKRHTKRE
jgi:hypothetical protein